MAGLGKAITLLGKLAGHLSTGNTYLLLFLQTAPHNGKEQNPEVMRNGCTVLDKLNKARHLHTIDATFSTAVEMLWSM